MALRDRIQKEIQTIDSRIADIKLRADNEIAALRTKRQVLVQARFLITDDLEKAVVALEKVGISLS